MGVKNLNICWFHTKMLVFMVITCHSNVKFSVLFFSVRNFVALFLFLKNQRFRFVATVYFFPPHHFSHLYWFALLSEMTVQRAESASVTSDDCSENPDDLYVDENNVIYLIENGKAINLAQANDLTTRSDNNSLPRNLSSSSNSSSASSTFTELQPASMYTQLPSIDTLSGSQPQKIPHNEHPQYVLYNDNEWK